MSRISEENRLPVTDNHIAHYYQANLVNGTPLEIEPGFGIVQLQAKRDAYATLTQEIAALAEEGGELSVLRAERDDLFGTSEEDTGGVWFWLKEYKSAIRARLGQRHPLARTVPNLGRIYAKTYLEVMHKFIVHWTRVNPVPPPAPPPPAPPPAPLPELTLGSFTLSSLQTAYQQMKDKIEAIDQAEMTLALKRAKREQDFGDEIEDRREPTSIVAWLLKYHSMIRTKFPTQPIASSLPEIFPGDASTPLPTIDFNYIAQPGGTLKTWYSVAGMPSGVTTVVLREGAVIQTKAFQPAPPGGVQVDLWSGMTLVDDLDEFEFRSAENLTLARGVRNEALVEPV